MTKLISCLYIISFILSYHVRSAQTQLFIIVKKSLLIRLSRREMNAFNSQVNCASAWAHSYQLFKCGISHLLFHWYASTVHIYFQIFRHYKKNFYSHVFKMRLQLRKTWLQDDLTYSHVFLGRVFKCGLNPMTIGLRDLWPHFFKRGYRPGPMATF